MTVNLVMLKSGEDIIADVKEIKSEEDVVGYFFHDPLIMKMYSPEEPIILNKMKGILTIPFFIGIIKLLL